MTQEKGFAHILEKVSSDIENFDEEALFTCVEAMVPEDSDEIASHSSISRPTSIGNGSQVLIEYFPNPF